MTINVSTLLDVALSLVFIFFTFSLFVSGIVEFINAMYDQRSRLLKLALIKVMDDKTVDSQLRKLVKNVDTSWETVAPTFAKFWNHPLVKVKRQIDDRWFVGNKPISYLNAESFSTVVLDILASEASKPVVDAANKSATTERMLIRIQQAVSNFSKPNPPESATDLVALAKLVGPLLEKSDTFVELQTALEHWYDGYMEQVSGWFKRNTQAVVWGISIVVTIAMNVDTLRITRQLFMDPALRNNLVAATERTINQHQAAITAGDTATAQKPKYVEKAYIDYLEKVDLPLCQRLDSSLINLGTLTPTDSLRLRVTYTQYLKSVIDELDLPIGWTFKEDKAWYRQILPQMTWLGLAGWALTATALSFGAPFWFDLLVKLVNIRNVAKKPMSKVVPNK